MLTLFGVARHVGMFLFSQSVAFRDVLPSGRL